MNNTLETITRIAQGQVQIEIANTKHVVEPIVWEQFRYAYDPTQRTLTQKTMAEFTQVPLRLT
jgi:hypothetical protein